MQFFRNCINLVKAVNNTKEKRKKERKTMNKVIVTMLGIVIIIAAIFTAIAIFTPSKGEQSPKIEAQVAKEEILDDCTDEYEEIEYKNTIKANAQEEKTSPNCSLIIKTYYKKCGHTKTQYSNLPQELINLNKEEIQNKYQDYEIESFSSNEVVLNQPKEGECGEHYMVKDKEGLVTIYQILEDGSQKEIETTGVSTEYLPQTDKINMQEGIQVNGKQELNQLIENFE